LIALACVSLLVPVSGFSSWLIAGPILFISLVMGSTILARGKIVPGLFILFTSLTLAPFVVVLAPIVSSLLGSSRMVPGIRDPAEAVSRTDNETVVVTSTDQPAESHPKPLNEEALQNGEYEQLKSEIRGQMEQVAALKSIQGLAEGVRGYLESDERLDIGQRRLVQQENFWRERLFALIGQRTGHSPKEIAVLFASMARRSAAKGRLTPPN
jgi:hypothetical protein